MIGQLRPFSFGTAFVDVVDDQEIGPHFSSLQSKPSLLTKSREYVKAGYPPVLLPGLR